jgi:hypothetical protein
VTFNEKDEDKYSMRCWAHTTGIHHCMSHPGGMHTWCMFMGALVHLLSRHRCCALVQNTHMQVWSICVKDRLTLHWANNTNRVACCMHCRCSHTSMKWMRGGIVHSHMCGSNCPRARTDWAGLNPSHSQELLLLLQVCQVPAYAYCNDQAAC